MTVTTDIFYMKAFHDLGTCRLSGMSLGPIPWTAMISYADRYGLEYDVAEAFVDIIRTMDIAYREYNEKEQKRIAEKNKPKTRSRNG